MSKSAKRERQRLNREARREAELQAERRSRMLRTLRNALLLLVPVAIAFVVLQIVRNDDSDADEDNNDKQSETPAPPDDDVQRDYSEPPPFTIDSARTYTATIETSEGAIVIDLDAAAAAQSVNNFVFLANNKFYNGLAVNRVAKDFVFQTGSPDNTQAGGPGYTVQGEVPEVAEGEPAYPVGTVAFGNQPGQPPGTAGSQFFVVFGDGNPTLPAQYALIGQVTDGLSVASKIGKLHPEGGDGPPTETVKITSVTIAES
ncbi:MAG: peptidylprolyl isomerase [Acidimicrobiia bacterium]